MVSLTEKRKIDHLKLCTQKDVSFKEKTTLLEFVELNYSCLPEISLKEVDLSTSFLGKNFFFPFLVSAITGGAQISKKVNLDIAKACQEIGIGLGLGSMRAMIENPKIKDTYFVRNVAPDIFVAGNIGVAQLNNYSVQQVDDALQLIEADALAIHVNSAQEAMQPEGDTDFNNLIQKISLFADEINVPVYVKEVGHGISFDVSKKLSQTNIKAVDVQGAGGTSWTRVDSLRHKKSFGEVFRDIGLPTAISIIETKNALNNSGKKIVATGGIRTGLEAVKSIVLGADMVGNALPILKAQQKNGSKGIIEYLKNFKKEMEITSFLLGCKNISELQKQDFVVLGKLKDWLQQ
ncbi:MAG: type 2 isopentenyl-diphosphate Delta-isomerase [Candidatus ainarchaeum sp.]|nr:type 2 isopentenyl-diphosphate Delta-isomerase [Candidatus ainarchaeum sp.]